MMTREAEVSLRWEAVHQFYVRLVERGIDPDSCEIEVTVNTETRMVDIVCKPKSVH